MEGVTIYIDLNSGGQVIDTGNVPGVKFNGVMTKRGKGRPMSSLVSVEFIPIGSDDNGVDLHLDIRDINGSGGVASDINQLWGDWFIVQDGT